MPGTYLFKVLKKVGWYPVEEGKALLFPEGKKSPVAKANQEYEIDQVICD